MATRKEVSVYLDMSTAQLSRLLSDGHITSRRGASLDLDRVRLEYITYLRNNIKNRGKGGDYNEERTRLTKAQADKAESEVDVIKGITVEVEDVLKVWTEMVSNTRARLIAMPSAISPQLHAARDEHEVYELLLETLNDALEELSGEPLPKSTRIAVAVNE